MDYENEMKRATINFEAVKLTMRQDKHGFILTLSVHPEDVPESLFRHWVGSRYQVAMVQLDDNEEPVIPKEKTDGPSRGRAFWDNHKRPHGNRQGHQGTKNYPSCSDADGSGKVPVERNRSRWKVCGRTISKTVLGNY